MPLFQLLEDHNLPQNLQSIDVKKQEIFMASTHIKNPRIFMRQAYFIACLRQATGMSSTKIEQLIRVNQYEKHRLRAPSEKLVKDYFLLYRGIAIDPEQHEKRPASWLIACELEFNGSSYNFFHPLFDMAWEPIESSETWRARIGKIPEVLIEEARNQKNPEQAQLWETMNLASSRRRHRRRETNLPDRLTFIHVSLLRLLVVNSLLFERKGLSPTWTRKYAPVEKEVRLLEKLRSFDGLAGIFGLVLEAAAIGDMHRFHYSKESLKKNINILKELPTCKKFGKRLAKQLIEEASDVMTRRYNKLQFLSFGLPMSWASYVEDPLVMRTLDKVGK